MTKATKPLSEPPAVRPNAYQISGLEVSDSMPISFHGQDYDLANLTDEQAAFLLQYPDQVPYLKPLAPEAPLD